MLTNTTEIGTATLPRRRLIIPAPTDVSPSAPRRPPRFPALAQFASAARRVPRAPIPVAFALAVLAVLATVAPEPAAAQTTFISNTGQTASGSSQAVQAVAFTTGTGTYTLSSVGIGVGTQSTSPTPVVKIYGDSGGNPGTTLVATMTNPGTIQDNAVNVFTAPANTTLSASTTYWVVTSNSAATNGQGFWVGVTIKTLDTGTAVGWSLGNARFKSDIAATSWTASNFLLRFAIRGTSGTTTNNPPTVATAIPDQSATAGTAFSYVFPANTFSDADTGDTLSYTATKTDDTALPTWLAFTASTRTFSGTPQAADAGTVAVKVTASDGNGGSVSDTFDITVIISVPADWSLKPTAVATGDKFRLLFLSSTKRNASSTDIADYNTFIQTRAAAGHTDIQDYSAGFRVVGCSAAVDARDNTKTTYTMTDKGVPIYWLNGAKAADQYEDFYDGSWDDEANDKNESGTNGPDTSQNNNWPVTGCSHGGTELTTFGASRALGTPQVGVGRPNSSGSGHGPLNGNSQITSGFSRPMYGLSAIFQVAADTTPPTLTSADVEITDALIINLEFSEDLQLSNPPPASAFTVTVDGSAATVSSVGVPGSALPQNALWLVLSTVITQGQAVVVAYADPTTGDDANAIQDAAGNDADSFTTGLNGVPDVINNVLTEVPNNWSLKPTGLNTGDQFRLLFLSSTKRNASSTDIADYNTFIQTRAAAGHTDIQAYSAGFRVVGCTADTDARDNTSTTYTASAKGVPIYWLAGAKAADQYEDFYDGSWDDEANDKNESGANGPDTSNSSNWPFTGCNQDGTESLAGDGRSRGLGSVSVRVGIPNSSGSGSTPLSSGELKVGTGSRPLYGLSGVFQVAAAVVVPNNPPAFSADTAARSVAENTAAGQNVGAALTATDADSDTLTYTLEGADAASFDIVSGSGQIQTRTGVTYNHEAKSTHTVVVKADDGKGGTDTVTVTITVTDVDEPPGQPAAPTVSATAGSTTSLDVTWTAPTNTGPAIASYDLQYRAGTSGNFTNGPQNVTGTSAAIGSLAADTSHQVQVRATNAEGDGDWSVAGTGRTTATSAPGAPTGLTATASGATQIDLSWSAPASTGGSAITGYKIEVSANGTSGWTDQVADTNSTATTYAHTGLAAGDTRHYRVSAINTNGAGTASNVANATTDASVPGAPTGLTATASGATQIDLSWSAPGSTGGSAITGYKIEVSANGTSGWTDQVANTNSTATTYAHTGLAAGDTRHYRVSAINTNGAGTASNVANATTDASVPGAPTGLTATASGATQIDLSWSAPASTGGSAITGYRIEVSSDGGSSWSDLVANTSNTATTYAHTGLAAGDTRHYRVSAINTNGAGTASNVANATTDASVPGAPTGLTATASGATQIDLSWSAPGSTGGSAITGYKIEVSANGTSGWTDQVANTNSTATTYAHTGLAAGDTRHYRVSAINTNGAGTASNVANATTDASVPGAPTGLTATASGATQIDLSWSAPGSTGGSAITGYKIEVSANGTSGWTDQVANTNSTATTYAHTGLAAGDTRHYRVSAINANGAGTASNVDSATTGTTAPTLTSADVEETNGLSIYLEFSEDLQLSNPPPASAFTLTVDGSAVTGFSVLVPGSLLPQNAIWLVLPTAIRQGQVVVVTYEDPTAGDDANAIQDTAGNDAATFTTGMDGVPAVTNNPTVTNTVPADWSLIPTGLSTGDKFRLLFLSSTTSAVSSTDIADYNTFIQTRAAAGHTDIRAYSAGFRVVGCSAAVDARDNTKTTYTTTDKGVPIYWLNGAKAADQYEDFYDGTWDDEANDKNESGTNGPDTSQAGNWPLTGCSHDGTEQWPLGASQVSVGRPNSSGSGHGPLFANAQITSGVSSLLYGLSAVFEVAAAVVVPNNPPAFSADTAARSVAENTAAGQNVGAALTATDADSDTLTYTLEGTDAASFDIVSGSGQIRTRTGVTYNHEAKSTYTVIVKADDGNGGTDTIAVTITVTDVDEPPGQPAAPSVSATAGSTTSLDVTWTAPTNTGPAIASYDLQYRAGTSGNFTDGPQNVTGTSAAIGSLAAGHVV